MLAVVTCHCAVGGFCFNDLAIWQSSTGMSSGQASRTLGQRCRTARHRRSSYKPRTKPPDHFIAAATMSSIRRCSVCDARSFELVGKFFFIDLGEQVLKTTVIGLEDCVLGRKVNRPAKLEAVVHGCTCKSMMLASRLYMPIATPEAGASNTSFSITVPSSPTNFIVSLPGPGIKKSVALYWSPKA